MRIFASGDSLAAMIADDLRHKLFAEVIKSRCWIEMGDVTVAMNVHESEVPIRYAIFVHANRCSGESL